MPLLVLPLPCGRYCLPAATGRINHEKETFSQVNVPVFLGYYYKDQDHQDQTVRVDAMLDMFEQLGTSEEQKVKVAFPEAGDHVIACELTSGSVQQVTNETISFGENILRIKPARILADF
jgi:hypothetical protein